MSKNTKDEKKKSKKKGEDDASGARVAPSVANHPRARYQVRRAASLRYCGDDIRFETRPWAPKQLHHTHRLNDGDPLSGPDFPVVWTRRRAQEAA